MATTDLVCHHFDEKQLLPNVKKLIVKLENYGKHRVKTDTGILLFEYLNEV